MGGCAPVTEATHGVALQGILLRRANKKAAPKGGLFMCVAERGGNSTLTVPPSSGGVHKPDLCPVVCPNRLAQR